MYLQYRNLKLIEISGRPNKDNEDILNGVYDNSETPLSKEERLKMIFFDWKSGDILVIADTPLKHPKLSGDTLVEMTREEVCATGDLSVLADGEVFEDNQIKIIPIPEELFKPKWEYPNWIEGMSDEEKENIHNQLIDTLKAELLEDGYIYEDKARANHQQKCRDKDLSYLGNAISSMEDASIPNIKWYFNNGDMLELTLEEMKGLRANGAIFINSVFRIEAQLKAEEPTKSLTLDMFRDKIDAISTIKCFRPTE